MKGALFSKKTILYLRSILEERRRRLARAVEGEISRSSSGHRGRASSDLLDAAIDSSARDLAFEVAAAGAHEVESIDRALKRMEEGSYGLCNECGQPIATARLKALPFAELCVKCQAKLEKENRSSASSRLAAAEYVDFGDAGEADDAPFRLKGRKLG